jgi:crotonobetainyl-CoA:carnitine CoA-transferase CaiB-like acyl-CoA transferase
MTGATSAAGGGNGSLPLDGACVVDFSRLLPGPWCTQALGDMGADVIKVEQPEIGDYGRFNPPAYGPVGVYFNSINRNKRSITLDLNDPQDKAAVRAILDTADIVVESFRAGVTQNLGIDYETVAKTNPSVIYCSVTGLGNDSAMGRVPGHDLSIQAVAGTLGKHLKDGEVPPMPTFQAGDFTAATYATIGILSAYIRRMRDGRGCYLEVPMYDSLVSASNVAMSGALARLAGHSGKPEMEPWGSNPRYCIYQTKDGKAVAVCLLEMRAWEKFCRHIGRADLIYEERWEDRHTAHGERSQAFREAIGGFCLSRTRDDLAVEMRDAGISITPVYSTDEALSAPHAKERGIVRFTQHPAAGTVAHFHDPLARAGLSDPERRPSPGLGEHSDEIRSTLAQQGQAPAARGKGGQ